MKTKWTLLAAGVLSAIVLSVSLVHAVVQPLMITNLSGTVRILQEVPCGDPVDVTARIEDGFMDITAYIIRNDVLFDLARLDLFLTPFSVRRECLGIDVFADFREIGVQLAGALRFPGEETGAVGSQLYRFRIPKEQFLIYESIVENAPLQQIEASYQRPSEDVTGLIDLGRRTVQLHVVLTTELRLRGGCDALGGHCGNQKHSGTQTADVLGVSTIPATPPTLTCTPVNRPGNSFQVLAADDSGPPIIHLGRYMLTNGEVIQLQQSGQSGVRLLETDRVNGIRQFQVGRGENFVTATDTAGNVTIAYCA